jgi:Bacterial Ig-like domain (group 2)
MLRPLLMLLACAEATLPELALDGPAEIRVSELGPVVGPEVRTGDGEVVLPGVEGPVQWSLSRPGVARFEGGVVVAEGPGQVVIGARWEDAQVDWTLRVELKTVVWFVDPPMSLAPGESRKLQVAATAGGVHLDPGRVLWVSSDPQVLSVDPYGIVTANEPGTSYITVRTSVGSAMVELVVVAR